MAELAASLQSAATGNLPSERPLTTQQHSPAPSPGKNAVVTTNTDRATALANASMPLSFSSEMADQPREREIETGPLQQDRRL
jgi:hypothetical protein